MSSGESDDIVDNPFEPENQVILRLPPVVADCLRNAVEHDSNIKKRLRIQLDDDLRNGTLRFDGWTLPFKVCDLPTIIESLKTIDGKTFYKTADISQMMICKETVDEQPASEKPSESKKKYSSSHGITPPLKNVKSKRFRKTVIKKNLDLYEIEKEVRRLLKTDSEAVQVRYELVDIDDEKNSLKFSLSAHSSKMLGIEEHDLFGCAVSSSEDEGDDCLRLIDRTSFNQTLNINDSSMNGHVFNHESTLLVDGGGTEESFEDIDSVDQSFVNEAEDASIDEGLNSIIESLNTAEDSSRDSKVSLQKLIELNEEISGLQSQIALQESSAEAIDNLMLKQRIMNHVDEMKQKEADLVRQRNEIKNLLDG